MAKGIKDKTSKNMNSVILPKSCVLENMTNWPKVLVLIHLHYIDSVDYYIRYVENIPSYADIAFTVDSSEMYEKLDKYRRNGKKILLLKENRGRDISALLVAGKTILKEYEFMCFIHDKKAKSKTIEEDISYWVYSMWENMLGSEKYIQNIIGTFVNNDEIGMMAPPTIFGKYNKSFFSNVWYSNYLNTCELAKKLDLQCDIDENVSPVAVGTCFWAKVSSLSKLFEPNWTYEDFDNEPLADDGTLSHAVERVLSYVVCDAGYETVWVMTDEFAGDFISRTQIGMSALFGAMKSITNIENMSDVETLMNCSEALIKFIENKDIYIYGAGKIAKKYYLKMMSLNISPKGFVVTKKDENKDYYLGVPVYDINSIKDNNVGIIIGVGEKYKNEVMGTLISNGFCLDSILLE